MSRSGRSSARLGGPYAWALALLLVTGCGGASPLPEQDPWIGLETGAETIRPGQAFPLVVTRIWRKDRAAAAWDEGALAPLDLRLEQLVRDEDEQRVRETRRYTARAFSLTDVAIPAVPFAVRARDGGEAEIVHAPAIRLRVAPTLDPTAPGAPELPGDPLSDGPPRAPWIAGALPRLVGLGGAARRRRRAPRAVAPPPEAPAPTPEAHEIALARLARLRRDGADVAAASEIVREYIADRYDVRAPYLSTEEVLVEPAIDGDARSRLAGLLALSDRTKFAAHAATASARERHLAEAEAFVQATARGATS